MPMGRMLKKSLTSILQLWMRMTVHRSLRHSKLDLLMNQAHQVHYIKYTFFCDCINSFFYSFTELCCFSFWGFVGTMVMKVIATDDDAENTLYSKIRYSIVEQSNMAGMFYINSQTGEVFVQKSILDREVSHITNQKYLFCCQVQLITLTRVHFFHRSCIIRMTCICQSG